MTLTEVLDSLRNAKPLLDRYGVDRIGVFGSVARGEEGPESDVDLLVQFHPDAHPGLEFFMLKDELETVFHKSVDLCTPRMLHRLIREDVLSEVVYVQG